MPVQPTLLGEEPEPDPDRRPGPDPGSDPARDTAPALLPDSGIRLRGGAAPAESLPVARVLLETSVPHLARTFDFGITAEQDAEARAGVRVRVRFSGRLVSGFLLERAEATEVTAPLAPLERIVSPVRAADATTLRLARAVGERWAGTLPDVLRLAVPPRHARGEESALAAIARQADEGLPPIDPQELPLPEDPPPALDSFLDALAGWLEDCAPSAAAEGAEPDGTDPADEHGASAPAPSAVSRGAGPRAAAALTPASEPGTGWITIGLRAAAHVLAAGRSVLWIVPDHRELDALHARLGPLAPHTVRLTADQGPQARWSSWVRAHAGAARLVIGTRAAAMAPVPDLGLVLLVDDGSAHYAEPRAPYPHAREVCLLRVQQTGAALLLLDHTRTTEVQHLVESGWVGALDRTRDERRRTAPLVLLARSDAPSERMPPEAFEVLRGALGRTRRDTAVGPALVQVPRAGYLPVVACARCRDLLDCPRCGAHLSAASPTGPFACAQCAFTSDTCACQRCGSTRMRAVVRGLDRTVEELERAFAPMPVIRSGGAEIIPSVGAEPAIVVATTGAEPYADGGYAAALLLDTLWPGPGLDGVGRAIARRLRALALVRSAEAGGRALVLDTTDVVVRVLQTFDPVRFAHGELADRRATGLPPVTRTVQLTGPRREVLAVRDELVAQVREALGEDDAEVLRPLLSEDEDEQHVLLLSFPLTAGSAVSAALRAQAARRSAAGLPIVRHVVDAVDAL